MFGENLVHINNSHFGADVAHLFCEPVKKKNRK